MPLQVLVTGAKGFVGRNLCASLEQVSDVRLFRYDVENTPQELEQALAVADVIFHLAGVNRPSNTADFNTGNAEFTRSLCDSLLARQRTPIIVLSSSVQAALDNPYGCSKRLAEIALEQYALKCSELVHSSSASPRFCLPDAPLALMYRLPNVFGKWCRPNYNSAVATWCHNIANDLPIHVRDPEASLPLVYVDDVINEFRSVLSPLANPVPPAESSSASPCCRVSSATEPFLYREVTPSYTRTLGQITESLYAFKASRSSLQVPDQGDAFTKKLYSTYLSFLPQDKFSYPLKMNVDARGSFTEMLKTPDRGQVSVNTSKPGITKGNHWHHTKHEKFLVVSGRGVIRLRKVGERAVLEYFVSSEKLEVVEIPPGYTHNIENLGDTDMVTVMWASELLDTSRPDTIVESV
jgi:UDP-2-acetamido-2,6-beta-L-arabino-hexul-4-ose reductase